MFVGALASVGCAPRGAERPTAPPDAAATGADSTIALEGASKGSEEVGRDDDSLLDDGTLDGAEAAGLSGDDLVLDVETREIPAAPREAPSRAAIPFMNAVSCDLDIVAGTRSEAKLRVEVERRLAGGVRRLGTDESGFIRFESDGFLRCVHAGGMTIRFGDRLVLGRGFGRFGSSDAGAVKGGISLSPSYSRCFAGSAAAAEIARSGIRLGTALLAAQEGFQRWRPNTAWTWGVLGAGRFTLGVVVGGSVAKPDAGSNAFSAARTGAASFHLAFGGDAVAASGEIARAADSGVFYAARVSERGRGHPLEYSLLLFRAPHESPVTPEGIVAPSSADQGARIDCRLRAGTLKASASLVTAGWSTRTRRTDFRRTTLLVAKDGRSSFGWEFATCLTRTGEGRYPSSPVDREIADHRGRDWRTRVVLRFGEGARVTPRLRIDYSPGLDGVGRGILAMISAEVLVGAAEARLQLAAYDIVPRRRMSLWEPGIGTTDRVAVLSGHGTDLALRVRLRVSGGGRLVASYATRWPEGGGVFVGAEYRR
jgi:hypothetical protein